MASAHEKNAKQQGKQKIMKRHEPVLPLGSMLGSRDDDASRTVREAHSCFYLVDVLPSRAPSAEKLNVTFCFKICLGYTCCIINRWLLNSLDNRPLLRHALSVRRVLAEQMQQCGRAALTRGPSCRVGKELRTGA